MVAVFELLCLVVVVLFVAPWYLDLFRGTWPFLLRTVRPRLAPAGAVLRARARPSRDGGSGRGAQLVWAGDELGIVPSALLTGLAAYALARLFSAHPTLPHVRFPFVYHTGAVFLFFTAMVTAVAAATARIIQAAGCVAFYFMRLGAGAYRAVRGNVCVFYITVFRDDRRFDSA